MAARVFGLDELATRIAIHLLAISPKTTVALALTCGALEVPALRTLWETQPCSLDHLIMRVLPTDAWRFIFPRDSDTCLLVGLLFSSNDHSTYSSASEKTLQKLRRPLTTWQLSRLERYASWVRKLDMREWGLSERTTRLVVPAPDGTPPVLRFHLRELNWWLNETNLAFFPEFLSPHLKKITVFTNPVVAPHVAVEPWDETLPDEVVPRMRSAIKTFPSSLQSLYIELGGVPETRLTEEISAFILQCGESLREFSTNLVLSTQAIVHLMKLPNLRVWVTEQGPPQVTDLIHNGLPDDITSLFPSLEVLELKHEAALEWLSLFEATENGTSPWITAGGSLVYRHPTLPIDSSLVSRLIPLSGLTEVLFDFGCFMRPCISKFTDQDIEHLAIALPRLEALTLGWPCSDKACPTTVRSLLSLSIHCTRLRLLNIHFRTENLQADMLELLFYAYSQGLQSKPKCPLMALGTGEIMLDLSEETPFIISMGMLMIFPSLVKFTTASPVWAKVEAMVMVLRLTGERGRAVTENYVKILLEAKERVENGVPTLPPDEMARVVCEPLN